LHRYQIVPVLNEFGVERWQLPNTEVVLQEKTVVVTDYQGMAI
jgi:hypothetical protein